MRSTECPSSFAFGLADASKSRKMPLNWLCVFNGLSIGRSITTLGIFGVEGGNAGTPNTGPPMSQLLACPTTRDITLAKFPMVCTTPKGKKMPNRK